MTLNLLGAWIRLLLLLATVVTVAAIGLGRGNPVPPARRVASQSSYQVLDRAITALIGGGSLIMDVESGRLETLRLPPGVGIDKASLSPWEEDGQRQLVGVGWSRSGSGVSLQRNVFGLVRMNVPDGEILDRMQLAEEALPAGPPCWIPGVAAGVLYAGGDFRLYRVDFESSGPDGAVKELADPQPRPLGWQTPVPGAGVQIKEVAWPQDPRLGGRAVATLRFRDGETRRYTDWQVWWLRLGRGATSVVAAGRLLEPGPADEAVVPLLPNLVTADGEPALAYLAHRRGGSGYQLRVAPVHVDPGSGSPYARDADARPLAEGCLPSSPAASPDGRCVTVFGTGGTVLRANRISTSVGPEPVAACSPRLTGARALTGRRAGLADTPGGGNPSSAARFAASTASCGDRVGGIPWGKRHGF